MNDKIKQIKPSEVDFKEKFSLKDKVIVITGGMGLIGKSFVEACSQFGANVVIADIEETDPLSFSKDINDRHKTDSLALSVNVGERSSVENMKEKILSKYGRIDGLVNCHQLKSKNFFAKFEEYTDEDWDSVMHINVKGTFLTCQILGSWMAENDGGAIVNLPSTYSVVAPNQSLYKDPTNIRTGGCPAVYSTSKGGIMALSQYLSTYWAHKNVRVNQITPHGVVAYGNWDKGDKAFKERFANLSPMGRMSFDHEVPGGLIFLLSDASSYITGHNLMVDGGWTVW